MSKVIMYKANDGSLHETQKACDAKNIELRTAPLVEEFVNSLTAGSVGVTADSGHVYIDLANLPDFLVAHADVLRALLNRAVQPAGRPRKPRDPNTPKAQRKPRAKKTDAPPAPVDTPAPAGGIDDVLKDLGGDAA
jgi:hypothetical protein